MKKNINIDDFRIKIKKYDRIKSVAIVNVIICEMIEIRGYQTRYATLKNPPYTSQWIVSPPLIKKKKVSKPFWIVYLLDVNLWHELQKEIIEAVIEYTNLK